MTYDQAIRRAQARAKHTNEYRYIVFEDGYDVCTEYDLDTFYLGAPVIAAVQPDGTIETAH